MDTNSPQIPCSQQYLYLTLNYFWFFQVNGQLNKSQKDEWKKEKNNSNFIRLIWINPNKRRKMFIFIYTPASEWNICKEIITQWWRARARVLYSNEYFAKNSIDRYFFWCVCLFSKQAQSQTSTIKTENETMNGKNNEHNHCVAWLSKRHSQMNWT